MLVIQINSKSVGYIDVNMYQDSRGFVTTSLSLSDVVIRPALLMGISLVGRSLLNDTVSITCIENSNALT